MRNFKIIIATFLLVALVFTTAFAETSPEPRVEPDLAGIAADEYTITKIFFQDYETDKAFKLLSTEEEIVKIISKALGENPKVEIEYYVTGDGDTVVKKGELDLTFTIDNFRHLYAQELQVTFKAVLPEGYVLEEGLVNAKVEHFRKGTNVLLLEELYYTYLGEKVNLDITRDAALRYPANIFVTMPESALTPPKIGYKVNTDDSTEDYQEVTFKQATKFREDQGFVVGDNVAELQLLSEDGDTKVNIKVHFRKEDPELVVSRVAGDNRILTAINVSKEYFDTADRVVIASSKDSAYVDALTAAPFAQKIDAPILLNPENALSPAVLKEIERLGAKKVYIAGGVNSVSQAVAVGLSDYEVERISGVDRFATSLAIAAKVDLGYTKYSAILVDGYNYPDALASSVIAGSKRAPILLTRPDGLPESIKNYLDDTSREQVMVVGGENSVSAGVVKDLRTIQTLVNVQRIAGPDRFATAIKAAEYGKSSPENILIASGLGHADALVAGALTEKLQAPVILVETHAIPKVVENYLGEHKNVDRIIVGGTSVVSTNVENLLAK